MHGNRYLRVQRGGFIEDKLGQMQRVELMQEDGLGKHRMCETADRFLLYCLPLRASSVSLLLLAIRRYGTWILDDRPDSEPASSDEATRRRCGVTGGLAQRAEELLHNDAVGGWLNYGCLSFFI